MWLTNYKFKNFSHLPDSRMHRDKNLRRQFPKAPYTMGTVEKQKINVLVSLSFTKTPPKYGTYFDMGEYIVEYL